MFSLPTLGADPIYGEFWIRADLMEIVSPGENLQESGDLSEREENALKELLEDARWAFSGMIYGYSVSWTPSSRSRSVQDELLIEPLALIPRGDAGMKTVSVVRENGFIYVVLEFFPDPTQQRRIEGWRSEAFPAASASALAPVSIGARRNAVEAAIRETLRTRLRFRDYNRPREIKGRVAFTEFPVTGLSGGSIRAIVTLRMDLEPLRHYPVD